MDAQKLLNVPLYAALGGDGEVVVAEHVVESQEAKNRENTLLQEENQRGVLQGVRNIVGHSLNSPVRGKTGHHSPPE